MKLTPKKSLGQHFLNSKHVLEQIITAACIEKSETILEIGPGTGVLTVALLQTGANIIAVEKDDRAYELLKEKLSEEIADGRLRLIHGDVLDQNIFNDQASILSPRGSGESPASYVLVANIPYYITGAILEKFLEHEPRPNRMVLLVQKEVAERIIARPPDGKKSGHGKESILSISVKAFGTPKTVANVSRGAFTPPPKVDSAILAIDNISGAHFQGKDGPGGNALEIKRFFEIVRAGFAHKRKLLKRNLEAVLTVGTIGTIWEKLSLDEKTRAEDMAIEDWLHIAAQAKT